MVNVIFSAAYQVLPDLLRERREARGVSKRELARLMRRSACAAIMAGRPPP